MKKKTKIVGVIFNTTSDKYDDKVYYYRTNKDVKIGDILEIETPRGGIPKVKIMEVKESNNNKYQILKTK